MPVSILAQKTMFTDETVVVAAASAEIPALMAATRSQVELLVTKPTWLIPKDIGTVRLVPNGTVVYFFEQKQTVVRQGHLMPARGIMEISPNVPFDIQVANLTNITLHAPKHMILCSSRNSMASTADRNKFTKDVAIRKPQYKATSKPLFQLNERANI